MDEFIAELWQVHLQVKQEGYTQVREDLLHISTKADVLAEPCPGSLQIRLHGSPGRR